MPDPEDLALQRPLATGNDKAKLAELAVESFPVEPLRDPGAGNGIRRVGRICQKLESEGRQACPDSGAHSGVPPPNLGQRLLLDEVKSDVELEHDRHGWCPRRLAGLGAGLVG